MSETTDALEKKVTAIAVVERPTPPQLMAPETTYASLLALAKDLVTTGFLPRAVRTPAQAAAIILTGRELGIGPMQSLRSVAVIEGKPALGADLQLGLFKRDGGKAVFAELTESVATLELVHPNGDKHIETFTIEDAQRAGLLSKDNWQKYKRAMLRSRVITAGLKSVGYMPTSGMYDPEELELLPDGAQPQGRVTEGVVDEAPPPVVPAPTVKVESETKVAPEMKRELHSLIKDLGLAVYDGGAGKPYLVAMPPAVLAVLGLPENAPPLNLRSLGIGAYAAIMPVLRMLHSTRSAEIDKAIEEAGEIALGEVALEEMAEREREEDAERGVAE